MEEDEYMTDLDRYLDMGVISLEGVDKNGEMIFSISENAKDLAPELWQSHIDYVDKTILNLYQEGLIEIEYDENLEANIKITPESRKILHEFGLIDLEGDK